MYFYKDAVHNLFHVGNDILPTGKYLLKIYGDDVSIESASRYKIYMFPVAITDLQKEDDSFYTDLDDLLNGVQDFFKGAQSSGDLTDVENRLLALENTTLRVIYYESITTTSGSVTVPTGASIVLDYWTPDVSATVSELYNGRPTNDDGGITVTSFNASGDYTLSGALPTNPAGLIYVFDISLFYYKGLSISNILEQTGLSGSGGSIIQSFMYISLISLSNSEGDIHLSNGLTWATSLSLFKNIKVVTDSTDWDLYLLQNDNGYSTDDADIPAKMLMVNGNLAEEISIDYSYKDEDLSDEVHLYWIDNSGVNTADFYITGIELN